jgi:hypothetical protein
MYIPPSQYTTGYYSDGIFKIAQNSPRNNPSTNPNILPPNSLYTGPYWKLKNGNLYTGEKPESWSQLLTPVIQEGEDNSIYPPSFIEDERKKINIAISPPVNKKFYSTRVIPLPFTPSVSKNEKNNNTMDRFFIKHNNKYQYQEIQGYDYNLIRDRDKSIAWDQFEAVRLIWTINGEMDNVIRQNKNSINSIEQPHSGRFPLGKNWTGFSSYFKNNFLQLYQGIQENLITSGGEYQTKYGKEYIGPYHIHPDKGPMVGEKHILTPHDYLYPIKRKRKQNQINPISPTPTYTPPSTTGGEISSGGGGGGY